MVFMITSSGASGKGFSLQARGFQLWLRLWLLAGLWLATVGETRAALSLQLPAMIEGSGALTNGGNFRLGQVAASNIVVTLTSSDPALVAVPDSVTVLAGQTNVTFTLVLGDNATVALAQQVMLTATAPGFGSASNTSSVWENDTEFIRFTPLSWAQITNVPFGVQLFAESPAGLRQTNFYGTVGLTAIGLEGVLPLDQTNSGSFSGGQKYVSLAVLAPGRAVQIYTAPALGRSDGFNVGLPPFVQSTQLVADILWHEASQRLLATVPATGGIYSNCVVTIDPVTHGVLTTHALGSSTPGQIEAAPDGSWAYIAISNQAALQRFDLNTRVAGAKFALGASVDPERFAFDFCVPSGLPDSVVVETRDRSSFGNIWRTGVVRYDHGVPVALPNFADGGWNLEALSSNSELLLSPNLTKGNAATGTIVAQTTYATPNLMTHRAGFIYDEAGGSYAAGNLQQLGSYPGVLDQPYFSSVCEVDSALGRVFYLSGYPDYGSGTYKLKVYDRDLRQPLLALGLPVASVPLGAPIRLVRCGTNGLAYANSNGELWFVRPDLIQSAALPADLRLSVTPNSPVAVVGADFQFTLTLSNAGPGIASLVRVTNTLPANVTVPATSASTGSVVVTNAAFTWSLAALPVGAQATLAVTLRYGTAGWQTNFAVALEFDSDPTTANNSAALPLNVELPPAGVGVFAINTASEDLLYDPVRDRLLLSVAANPSGPANGLAILNPYRGLVDSFTPLTQRPGRMARTEDGQFLYVSLPGDGLVRRLALTNLLQNLEFALGGEDIYGTWYPAFAADLATVPGNPSGLAVWRVRRAGPMAGEFGRGLAWFDDGVMRTNFTAAGGDWRVEFDRDSGTLFGYNNGDLRRCAVDAGGITFAEAAPALTAAGADIELAAGQIFTTAGRIVTPQPFKLDWLVAGAETAVLVEPDATANRLYYLTQTNGWQLRVHELNSRRWLGSLPISNLSGTPTSLIRWGTNGLAFRTSSNQLFLIRTPFTQPEASAALAVQIAGPTGPVAVGETVAVTVTVTNAGPAAAELVQITNRFSPAVPLLTLNPSAGTVTTNASGFVWSVPSLAAGAQVTLAATVQAGSTGAVTLTTSASSRTPDPLLGDNTALLVLSVGAGAEPDSLAWLNLPANDLVWSPTLGRLLITASNSTPNWAGCLLSLEPLTRELRFETSLGGDVNRLALADRDGRLYAGVDWGLSALSLPGLTVTQQFLLNVNDSRARIHDLEVMPGNSTSVLAGSRSFNNSSAWLAVYDSGVRRTNIASFNATGFSLEFGLDPNLVYYQDHSAGGFRRYVIETNGITLLDTDPALLPGSTAITLAWADGHLFTSPGWLIDPFTRTRVGQAAAITNNSALCYDATAGRAYFVSTAGPNAYLHSIDKASLVATDTRVLNGVTGQVASLVRWGADGLAFRTTGGQLGLVRTELIPSAPPADLALQFSALQPLGVVGSNFSYTISVTNAGPNAAANSQVLFRISTNATIAAVTTAGGTWTTNATQLVARWGNLPVGGTATVTVTVLPRQPGSLLAVASATSSAIETNRADNAQTLNHSVALQLLPGATTILAQTANDLAYAPPTGRLYVSGAAGGISVINPALALVETNWPMPSAPTRLALTDDGQYLYVGLDAGRRVGRVATSTGALEQNFSLGTNGSTPFVLVDFAPMPGASPTLAVTKQAGGSRSLQILDDGVLRPGMQLATTINHLEFGDNPGTLYGTGVRQFLIGPTNLTELGTAVSAVANDNVEYAAGHFYTTGGKCVEAASRVVVGSYSGLGAGTLVEPDAAHGRVYFLTRLGVATGTWQVRAYEPATGTFLGNTTVSNVLGSPTNFVRWGADGLAFCTTSNQVFLLRSPLVPANPATDLAVAQSCSPPPYLLNSNLTFTLTVTNAGPHAATNVLLLQRYPATALVVGITNSQGSVTQALGTISWLPGTLTNGATAQVQITLRPLRAGPFDTFAVLTSGTSDPVGTNNSVTSSLPVQFRLTPDSLGIVDLPTADLAYDPVSGLLYATPANQPGDLADSVIPIDPETGLFGTPFAVAPDLSQLSISDDGSRLYVLANRATEFRRLHLPTRTVELVVPGAVNELEPVPGTTNSVVVTRPNGGVVVYDDAQARTNAMIWYNQIEFYAPDQLLGFWSSTTPNWTARLALDSNGVSQASENAIYLVDGTMAADAGMIYTSGGSVIDPQTLTRIRSFGVTGPVLPQVSMNRVAFVTDSGASTRLRVFDTLGLLERGSLAITNALGSPAKLIRCGPDRFAFRTTGGQIIIVRSAAMPSGPATDLALGATSSTATPTAQQPFAIALCVTNLGPATATAVTVSNALPASLSLISATLSQGTLTGATPALLWHVGELAAGAVATNQLLLTPQIGGAFAAQSLVYANAADSNAVNDVAGVTWLVNNAPATALSTLDVSAGDLVWEPISQRLVMTVTAPSPTVSNSLLRLDPVNGQFAAPIPVGPQPGKLAITADGQTAYVGLDSPPRLLAVNLATGAMQTNTTLPGKLLELELPPNNPNLVVTLQDGNLDAYLSGAELPLTGPLPWDGPASLTHPNFAGRFYGYVGARNIAYFTPTFYRMTVNSSGWVINDTFESLLTGAETTIESAAGLVFASSGTVLQPETLTIITNLTDLAPNSLVCPDPAAGVLTFLTPKDGQWWLRQYSHGDYSVMREIRVPRVTGTPKSLVRWGADGLAFLTTSNQVYLLRPTLAVADLALTPQSAPTQAIAGIAFDITWSVTNRGPAVAADAIVTNLPPAFTQVLAASASHGQITLTNNRAIFALGDLAPNTVVTLSVSLLPTNTVTTILTNFAVATHAFSESVPGDNGRAVTLMALADRDRDGLPDEWELANGLSPTNAVDAALDSDCDGLTNLQEYQTGSNPQRFEAVRLHSAHLAGPGVFAAQMVGAVGKTYTLEGSTNLTDWSALTSFLCRSVNQPIQATVPYGAPRYFVRLRSDTNAPMPLLTLLNGPLTNPPLIGIAALPGHFYTLQVSSNLVNWTTVSNYFGVDCVMIMADPSANLAAPRFYRLRRP